MIDVVILESGRDLPDTATILNQGIGCQECSFVMPQALFMERFMDPLDDLACPGCAAVQRQLGTAERRVSSWASH